MLSTTKTENQLITTKAKFPGELFIFGSWLDSETPRDLDLLFVYDKRVCSPQVAIEDRRALMEYGARLGLPAIHVVLLSESESVQCRFIESEGAVPLQKWIYKHPDSVLRRFIDEVVQPS